MSVNHSATLAVVISHCRHQSKCKGFYQVTKDGQFQVTAQLLWYYRHALHSWCVHSVLQRDPWGLIPWQTFGSSRLHAESHHVPCRNDGQHHVLTSGPSTTRCTSIVKAVVEEVNGRVENKHCQLIKHEDFPEDAQVVPSVWSMQHKHNLTTNKITKHKARLNLHGGKQVYGMNYYETYTLVVIWFAIRPMIAMSIIFCWALCQVNYVIAYSQDPVETDIYMELPQGIKLQLGTPRATCSSYSRTSTVRNKLDEYGILFLWTSSYHWATLLP